MRKEQCYCGTTHQLLHWKHPAHVLLYSQTGKRLFKNTGNGGGAGLLVYYQCPHSEAATTTGTNSLTEMSTAAQDSGHAKLNHWEDISTPPHPNDPDASVNTSTLAVYRWGKNMKPFHLCKKQLHHIKSALAMESR